jgi:hypothetical protein
MQVAQLSGIVEEMFSDDAVDVLGHLNASQKSCGDVGLRAKAHQ